MAIKIFVNLPVTDLDRSTTFFSKLGFTFNPQFTDTSAACMVIAVDIHVMLLTLSKFKEFTTKVVANAHETTEVLTCLGFDSRAKVDEIADAALAAGGSEAGAPKDYGFMYERSFNDLDGHIWECIWLAPSGAAA